LNKKVDGASVLKKMNLNDGASLSKKENGQCILIEKKITAHEL